MLQHSFVLDSLETTGADTFEHFEMLVEEHRSRQQDSNLPPSRLQQLVPTIGTFHTPLPLRKAFQVYNEKHKLTKRKHIQISFNEIRHILNLAQIMALTTRLPKQIGSDTTPQQASATSAKEEDTAAAAASPVTPVTTSPDVDPNETTTPSSSSSSSSFNGPKLVSFDGDQTLYSDGANFDSNVQLAHYLYQLLRNGVTVAVVTAAGYEYQTQKYEYRLSGLLRYFQARGLTPDECDRFYLFGGECNYLLRLGADYKLQPVKEHGPGGWMTATQFLPEAPAKWSQSEITELLDLAEQVLRTSTEQLALRGRVIRKKRSVGLVPLQAGSVISRESLDECVLRAHEALQKLNNGAGASLPFCSFNGGSDVWVDVGNKRVGVQILQSFCGIDPIESLHIGDQFLNTGNDYAARSVSPCVWIISPQETTYILKSILRLAGVPYLVENNTADDEGDETDVPTDQQLNGGQPSLINFAEMERRAEAAKKMDVYTGDMIKGNGK